MRAPASLLLPLFCAFLPLGCDGVAPPTDAAPPDGASCLDDTRFETCADGACETTSCRGDELCVDAACVPWTEAELSCAFTLERSETADRRIFVQVDAGGFPRAQVEALRFDFGDGVAGYGETLGHEYAEPGVYAVTLEVRLTGLRYCRERQLALIDPGPDHSPLAITVNRVPAILNGSVPFDRGGGPETFVLSVPRQGFTVDVTRLEDPSDPLVSVSLTSDGLAGELFDRVSFEDEVEGSWIVDEELPLGTAIFTLTGTTESGATHERTLTVQVVDLLPERNPIDRPQVWLFLTETDLFTTRRVDAGGRFTMVSDETPNGLPDFAEEMAILGAQGSDDVANAIYLSWIREAIRREVYRTYGISPDGTPLDDIPLTVFWEGEPGAPDAASFDVTGDVSLMRFGGTFDGFVGFSGISPWNEERTDDSTLDRGIATASLIGILTGTPVVSEVLAPIEPSVGVPVGEHPRDAEALDPAFDRYALDADPEVLARHETLRTLARYLALAIATVTAHEMGHAMGLMPNGVPPLGFFGNVRDVPFVNPTRTNRWHADLPGLNLMQAGGDYLGVVDEALMRLELPRGADIVLIAELLALENRLSAYSRAYMQGRLTYDSADGTSAGLSVGCALY